MEMMNRAIEDASDFKDLLGRIQKGNQRLIDELHREQSVAPKDVVFGGDRQPGENRAMHRARLKSERSAATQKARR